MGIGGGGAVGAAVGVSDDPPTANHTAATGVSKMTDEIASDIQDRFLLQTFFFFELSASVSV